MKSLNIDENFMVALVDGDPRAALIAESWKFTFPVTEMTSLELDELSERCRTTFNFPRAQRSKGPDESED